MNPSFSKMEARGSAARTSGPPRRPPATPDPFRLGFRYRTVTAPDGREVLEQVLLTSEDLLYPQEGDVVSNGWPHYSFLHPWAEALRCWLGKRPGLVVTSDVVLVLRHDGRNCSPDVAVIEGGFDTDEIDGAIHLREVGGRLAFVLEAVSTSDKEIESKDVAVEKNPKRYAAEGVDEYFTLYPEPGRRVSKLVGRRLRPSGGYDQIAPDARGRVASAKLGLLFSIDPETEKLVIEDAATGERLRLYEEETAARRKAEAEIERLQAELRQLRGGSKAVVPGES